MSWSTGARPPRRGRDSIWIAERVRGQRSVRRTALINPPTRHEAMAALARRLVQLAKTGRRVLVGFDFPFGYPAGTAARLNGNPAAPDKSGPRPWLQLWQTLADGLEDDDANRNNPFDLAESLNRQISGEAFPFWGEVRETPRRYLRRRGRRPHGPDDLPERRICERFVRRTQPVWKLAGVGAVGGQALTGIPRVLELRQDPRIARISRIWPFETGLRHDPRPQILFAEVYPSLIAPTKLPGLPKDAGQVDAVTRWFARIDSAGALAPLFAGAPGLSTAQQRNVTAEEAWILGVT
jgi:precorrin-8X/cobalt-precorrin-8 methylmutase